MWLRQRRWARAAALFTALSQNGCYVNRWGPLPQPVPLQGVMKLKVALHQPEGSPVKYTEIDLYRPRMQGDSVIVGVTYSDRGSPGQDTRVRVDEAMMLIDRHVSWARTTLAVLGGVTLWFSLEVLSYLDQPLGGNLGS